MMSTMEQIIAPGTVLETPRNCWVIRLGQRFKDIMKQTDKIRQAGQRFWEKLTGYTVIMSWKLEQLRKYNLILSKIRPITPLFVAFGLQIDSEMERRVGK